jgi:hypothetical protein
MWGDMLLNQAEGEMLPHVPAMTAANAATIEEAQILRRSMPPGAIIADWRYEPGDEQRNGLALFRAAGHDTLACPWFQPENIRGWARQAIANGSLGLLGTTWAGYDISERSLDTENAQFAAFVLDAEYAWSGSTKHAPDDPFIPADAKALGVLPYHAQDLFARSYRDSPPIGTARPGWYLSLRQAANVELGGPWPYGAPIAAFPAAQRDIYMSETADEPLAQSRYPGLGGVGARVVGTRLGGVMLAGRLNRSDPQKANNDASRVQYPAAAVFAIGARAGSLAMLQATAFGIAKGAPAGHYTVFYADGRTETIPLRYGYEIAALEDQTPAASLRTSSVKYGEGDARLQLRLMRWYNPRPSVTITRIELDADDPFAAPILFGVTGW